MSTEVNPNEGEIEQSDTVAWGVIVLMLALFVVAFGTLYLYAAPIAGL